MPVPDNAPLYDNDLPRYLPHCESPELLRMGLARFAPTAWIETGSDVGTEHRHKREMGAARFADVYAETPEGREPAAEFAELLESHLLADQPAHYRREGQGIRCLPGDFCVAMDETPPLWRASLLVADDLAVMQRVGGDWCLVAASLCSPSHWRLADKLGKPMRVMHDPIPGIHDDLSARIDRFFDHLREAAPVTRFNWALQFGDTRFCSGYEGEDTTAPLYYRVERQSLRRLPHTGAIAFTIRVYRHPLSALTSFPGALDALLSAVRATPPGMAGYKSFDRYLPALEAALAEL